MELVTKFENLGIIIIFISKKKKTHERGIEGEAFFFPPSSGGVCGLGGGWLLN